MRRTAGYRLLDQGRNENILYNVHSVENKLVRFKQKWLNHVSRVEETQN
jgi:hypothetical protein